MIAEGGNRQLAEAMQHVAATNAPDPKTVGVATGLVKYDLVNWTYQKPDGTRWEMPACVIVRIEDGRITRLDEYLDSVDAVERRIQFFAQPDPRGWKPDTKPTPKAPAGSSGGGTSSG